MRYLFVIIVVVASTIVILAHFFVYFSYLRFFSIGDPATKRFLTVACAILSISFIASLLLIHWHESVLTKSFYLTASLWIGTFIYLLIGAIVIWALFAAWRLIGVTADFRILAATVILLAVGWSVYGVWNAFHPRVVEIEVSIANLPQQWQGRKIIQISDIHLGAIHGQGFMKRVVDKIKAVNPDVIFITGDLFDGGGDDLKNLAEPLHDLRPPLGMFFITGNHETYVGVERSLQALSGLPVKVLRNEAVDLDGIQLVGVDYPTLGQRVELTPLLAGIDSTKPSIVLFHEPRLMNEFKSHGVNLQLSGHTHVGQLWPFGYITHRVYSGFDYGLHVSGSFSLYTSSGVGTWGPPMRTGNRPEIVVISLRE